jgi:hypothetical protein
MRKFFFKIYNKYYCDNRFLCFEDNNCKLKENSKIITLNNHQDAFYDKNNKKLYFKDFQKISSIFCGIETFFREAKAEEIVDFNNYSFLSCSNIDASINKTSLKRIAAIITSKKLDSFDVEKTIEYMKSNCGEDILNLTDDRKFIIKNDKDISKFYSIVFEEYYIAKKKEKQRVLRKLKKKNKTIKLFK